MIIEKIALYFNCIRPFDFKLVVIWSMKHPLDVQKTSKQFDFSECSVPSSACILFFLLFLEEWNNEFPPENHSSLKIIFIFILLLLPIFSLLMFSIPFSTTPFLVYLWCCCCSAQFAFALALFFRSRFVWATAAEAQNENES